MKNVISEKQLAANRANAKNSTGPLTDEGKSRSSLNSLKHGLLANRLIPGEDQKLYEEFYQDWINDLKPLGMQQVVIADQIIMTAFKIMRCHQLEASLWNYRVVRESAFTYNPLEENFPKKKLSSADITEYNHIKQMEG